MRNVTYRFTAILTKANCSNKVDSCSRWEAESFEFGRYAFTVWVHFKRWENIAIPRTPLIKIQLVLTDPTTELVYYTL